MALAGSGLKKVVGSSDTTFDGFDLFSVPPTMTSVARGEDEEHLPISTDSLQSEVEFRIPPGDKAYSCLATSRIELEVEITKENGSALDGGNGAAVWPGDNFAHALFDKAVFRIGEQDMEYVPNYAFRAYLENLLNFQKEDKKGVLATSSGWFEDGARGKDGGDGATASINVRKAKRRMSFFMKPRISFAAQDRLLHPDLSFSLKLRRGTDKFALMAANGTPAGGGKIRITKAVYHVRRMIATDPVYVAHSQQLLKGERLKYPLDRARVSQYTLNPGTSNTTFKLDQSTQKPNSLVVGLVSAEAVNGAYGLNPFRLQHFGLNKIEVSLGSLGERITYEPNFTTGEGLARPYSKLAQGVERLEGNRPFGITFDEWREDSNLYFFDFTGDLTRGSAFHLFSDTSITIRLQFDAALTNSVIVVVYQQLDDLVTYNVQKQASMISSAL